MTLRLRTAVALPALAPEAPKAPKPAPHRPSPDSAARVNFVNGDDDDDTVVLLAPAPGDLRGSRSPAGDGADSRGDDVGAIEADLWGPQPAGDDATAAAEAEDTEEMLLLAKPPISRQPTQPPAAAGTRPVAGSSRLGMAAAAAATPTPLQALLASQRAAGNVPLLGGPVEVEIELWRSDLLTSVVEVDPAGRVMHTGDLPPSLQDLYPAGA